MLPTELAGRIEKIERLAELLVAHVAYLPEDVRREQRRKILGKLRRKGWRENEPSARVRSAAAGG